MPINSIATASKWSSELDKMLKQKSVVGFFEDNNFRAKFVGAKTVVVPDIDFVGLADYDKDNGFATGKTTIANTSYTLSKDRARSLQIDREDLDESGVAALAGKVLGEYIRTEVVPEVDAYCLSKLYSVAQTQNHVSVYNSAKPYNNFVTITQAVQNAAGYDQELVCFVDGTAYAALMNSTEISKFISVQNFKNGGVDLQVKTINGIPIIPVSDARMKSAYTFDAGATSTAGGFTPTAGAYNIRMLVLPRKGASLVKKTETMRIFTPEQNKDADAYVFNYRLYYDIFVKKSNLDHIYVAAEESE